MTCPHSPSTGASSALPILMQRCTSKLSARLGGAASNTATAIAIQIVQRIIVRVPGGAQVAICSSRLPRVSRTSRTTKKIEIAAEIA